MKKKQDNFGIITIGTKTKKCYYCKVFHGSEKQVYGKVVWGKMNDLTYWF